MKLRVVLITENDSPVEKLGKNATEKIKNAWELLLGLAEVHSENGDRGYVESVEILED
jgi:hypothetical protein